LKRRIIAAALALLLLTGGATALAAAGSADDPLISLSYVETYISAVLAKAREAFSQPLRELGEKSVETLHAMIENEPGERTIILRPTLVPGGSVADRN